MIAFVLSAAGLAVLAAGWATRPLWWRQPETGARSAGLAAALAIFMFGVAGGGYLWVGSPGQLSADAAATRAAAPASPRDAVARAQTEQIAAMVERLAERLKTQPDDPAGWQMLARSYTVLGRHAQAVEAYRAANRLQPDNATVLADLAVALTLVNGRNTQGEPAALVERALTLDAKNTKALAFAGMVAFDRKDYSTAVRRWEALARIEPAGSPYAQQIAGSIAQARQLAGMPPAK
ncbi:tetratricopeptide repeat protein [Piscinibacter sp.]|uniref:tetratricopeptide repeat protein n=1 Tax=Piscinibacter sp. TaxID=1903157 RepID=UPI002BC6D7B5|nr:tetratricopeptide repeat protein [Albitalea sp.]HUG22320.1 tetratricopeptide repeat protein [Albitalea sp.]